MSKTSEPYYPSTDSIEGLADVPKVTLTERRSLTLTYNLADAQNYISASSAQRAIIEDLTSAFDSADTKEYDALTHEFVTTVLGALGQVAALKPPNHVLPCYSATIGLEVAANFVRLKRGDGRPVGLIHPTFDTLAYISRRHNLNIRPVEEADLVQPERMLRDSGFGVLILTLPNNPTGFRLSPNQFAEIVTACKRNDVLLIVDCCYRYYDRESFDMYSILHAADVDYFLVEDTGKLFPLLDVKLGLLNCNDRIFSEVNSIHSDFLLEVSKLSMTVISQFFRTQDASAKSEYLATIEANRSHLLSTLKDVGVTPIGGENINVQLLKLPAGLTSKVVQSVLANSDVGIIDATRLYWADPTRGNQSIRIALARDPEYFAVGVACIRACLVQLIGAGGH